MSENAQNSAPKQRGKPFPKGKSGNPNGKPQGALNRSTIAVQQLLEGESEALTRKCVELALGGDSTALRLCMERIAPAPKDRAIRFPMPPARTPVEVNESLTRVIEAVGNGVITPAEGSGLASLLDAQRRGVELVTLEERVAALEAAGKTGGSGR